MAGYAFGSNPPGPFIGLCDDEAVPLICPTCQVLAQSVLAGDRRLLCMGLFSIFLIGSQSDTAWLRESCLNPDTPVWPFAVAQVARPTRFERVTFALGKRLSYRPTPLRY